MYGIEENSGKKKQNGWICRVALMNKIRNEGLRVTTKIVACIGKNNGTLGKKTAAAGSRHEKRRDLCREKSDAEENEHPGMNDCIKKAVRKK